MPRLVSQDDCNSIEAVRERISANIAWRKTLYRSPAIAPAAQARQTPALQAAPPQRDKLADPSRFNPVDLDLMAEDVCVAFEVTPQQMVEETGNRLATGALKAVVGLCIRRLEIPRADVCERFGITEETAREAIALVNRTASVHALTRFSRIQQVAALLRREYDGEETAQRHTVKEIISAVSSAAGIPRNDLLSARRTANIVLPRQVAMGLAKRLTLKSLPEIGRLFGGRDHTTVLHAVRKMRPTLERLDQEGAIDRPLGEIAKQALDMASAGIVDLGFKAQRAALLQRLPSEGTPNV